ncbi:hypothetical protein [Phenylobacterium sp. SCN 70-31]|uniref:hypothetical protein n=1 Tax=Phenylobacterium sp. SCN 70-31 TaxID=1660129 RepID=UPI00086D8FD4|nr:hypothetical protein [Phenylobacterium sp. SCN 70-31]ODT87980.1 MAG: hypothetical protein ABS78_08735 [Phenylobacterium sp. SCN 70-31]
MRALTLACVLALAACSSGAGYGRSGGLATYDDLRAAQEACSAKGGDLRLKRNGDAKYLDDYACETK